MTTVREMTNDLLNKEGVNPDGYYGYQCKDVFDYVTLTVNGKIAYGNAIDIPAIAESAGCEYIPNPWASGVNPQEGDVVVYSVDGLEYGHCGYVLDADETYVYTLEQNVDGNADFLEVGGPLRKRTRPYQGNGLTVLGWARPAYDPEYQSDVAPAEDFAGTTKVKDEDGTMVVGVESLNVRTEPNLNSEVVATYSQGDEFHYDSVFDGHGYRWLSYVSYSGERRYVAYRELDGELFGEVY